MFKKKITLKKLKNLNHYIFLTKYFIIVLILNGQFVDEKFFILTIFYLFLLNNLKLKKYDQKN